MVDVLLWLPEHLLGGFVNMVRAVLWLAGNLDSGEVRARIIFYGGSTEFFFVVLDICLVILAIGLFRRRFLWAVVRGSEWFHNTIGRVFAWAGLILVIQQLLIIFLQRIFRQSDIPLGPFGILLRFDISWYSEGLKLYNAMLVALCCTYTFVQGGHVRVDLIYAGLSHRAKRMMDMIGSLIFVLPLATVTWLFAWYFMWRHLVTPPVAAADSLESILRKARIMKWSVETIGFSPNGFNGYFLFKVLMVTLAGLLFLQGVAFFYRNLLEYLEGEASANRYLDRDSLEEDATEDARRSAREAAAS